MRLRFSSSTGELIVSDFIVFSFSVWGFIHRGDLLVHVYTPPGASPISP